MAELVDALDLGSSIARCESSSLSVRTIFSLKLNDIVGISPSGKAPGFDLGIPRFKSWYSSHSLLPKRIENKNAEVAELVDALDLGSSIARCESSSLSFRTIYLISFWIRTEIITIELQLEYRQAVRHRVLISAFPGSNPGIPAILF